MIRYLNLFFFLFISVFIISAQNSGEIKVSSQISLVKLNEDIYLHRSLKGIAGTKEETLNGLIVKSDSGIIIIDTPENEMQTKMLYRWLEKYFNSKVAAVVVTQANVTSAGGLEVFKIEGIRTYSSKETRNLLIKQHKVFTDFVFSDSLSLSFGNKNIEMFYPGKGCSVDNIAVFIKEDKILFAGSVVQGVNEENIVDCSKIYINEWKQSLNNLKKRYNMAKMVIPKKGEPGNSDIINHTIQLINSQK